MTDGGSIKKKSGPQGARQVEQGGITSGRRGV